MEDFIKEFDETTNDLLNTIASFSQEEFNTIPFEGSWTAAQVTEHLLKSESRMPALFKSNSRPTTEREPDGKTAMIKSIFLDFNSKLQSPEFILPSSESKEKEDLFNAFKTVKADIRAVIETVDLSRTFTDFPFPQLGEFTGWEWICFLACHAKRHTRQMKNIKAALVK
ncbi:MAG: DinB family protein [Flavisolibacter sp.]